MNKELIFKAFLMIFLIVTLPISIPVVVADTDNMPEPGEQCEEKAAESQAFIDFMDNGIISTLEKVAALLFAVATLVNTIDYFITLISANFGLVGADGSFCCPAASTGYGTAGCKANWLKYSSWTTKKNTLGSVFLAITNFATCACCSGGGRGSATGSNTGAATASNWDLCPLGNLGDMLGDALPGAPTSPGTWGENEGAFGGQKSSPGPGDSGSSGVSMPTLFDSPDKIEVSGDLASSNKLTGFAVYDTITGNEVADPPTDASDTSGDSSFTGPVNKGIGQFHISAFDNIYTAVGCLCPVAILFNLRKLKTIHQVHKCCIEQACENGQSTEVCERQYDEATCMYWKGSIMKTLVTVLASIAAGYITKLVWKYIGDNLLVKCILVFLELTRIPGRIMAVTSSFEWLGKTFSEPECGDLGFEDIEEQFESGIMSQSAGINTVTLNDNNNDGIYDRLDNRYKERALTDTEVSALDESVLRNMEYQSGSTIYIREDNYGNPMAYRAGNGLTLHDTSGQSMEQNQFYDMLQSATDTQSQFTQTAPITVDGRPIEGNQLTQGQVLNVPTLGDLTITGGGQDGVYQTDRGEITVQSSTEGGYPFSSVLVSGDGGTNTQYRRYSTATGTAYTVKSGTGDNTGEYTMQDMIVYSDNAVINVDFDGSNPSGAVIEIGGRQTTLNQQQTAAIMVPLQQNINQGDFTTLVNLATEMDNYGIDTTSESFTVEGTNIIFDNTDANTKFTYDIRNNKMTYEYKKTVAGNEVTVTDTREYSGSSVTFRRQEGNLAAVSFTMDRVEFQKISRYDVTKIQTVGNKQVVTFGEGDYARAEIQQDGNHIEYFKEGDAADKPSMKVEVDPAVSTNGNMRLVTTTTRPNGYEVSQVVLSNKEGETAQFSGEQWAGIMPSGQGVASPTKAEVMDAYKTLEFSVGAEAARNARFETVDGQNTFSYTSGDTSYSVSVMGAGDTRLLESTGDDSWTETRYSDGVVTEYTSYNDGYYVEGDYNADGSTGFYVEDEYLGESFECIGDLSEVDTSGEYIDVAEGTKLYYYGSELEYGDYFSVEITSEGQVAYVYDDLYGTWEELYYDEDTGDWSTLDGGLVYSNDDIDYLMDVATSSDVWEESIDRVTQGDSERDERQQAEADRRKQQEDKEKARRETQIKTEKNAQMQKVAYAAVWELTNLILQEWAYPMIDEMCKQDWEASEPAEDDPTDTHSGGTGTGGTGGTGGGTGSGTGNTGTGGTGGTSAPSCNGPTVASQLRITGDDHHITYTVSACNELLHYIVILKGAGIPDYVVDDGYAPRGSPKSGDVTEPFPVPYSEICVDTAGDLWCSPAVTS